MFEVGREVLGHSICAQVTLLDEGINVLLVGGSRTHIGSVSFAENDEVSSLRRTSHKEYPVTEEIAGRMSKALNMPVCVECGIHYENPSEEELKLIVGECYGIADEIVRCLQ
jgi:hypothetical protein